MSHLGIFVCLDVVEDEKQKSWVLNMNSIKNVVFFTNQHFIKYIYKEDNAQFN